MRTSQKATVILLPATQKFISILPEVDKTEVLSELELPQHVDMLGTHFRQVATDSALWGLNIPANGHNWCILAYLEQNQSQQHYLVCTHAFKQSRGDIPQHELDRALRLYQLSQQMGGV